MLYAHAENTTQLMRTSIVSADRRSGRRRTGAAASLQPRALRRQAAARHRARVRAERLGIQGGALQPTAGPQGTTRQPTVWSSRARRATSAHAEAHAWWMATDRSPELEDGVNQQDDGDALVSEFNAAQAACDAIREDSLSQHGRTPDELNH